jgi:L,D-transpeptidase YcbB
VHVVDPELIPARVPEDVFLARANPIFIAVRAKLTTADDRALVEQDLDRLRLIRPAPKFILVDTASERLWMIEHGKIAGTMKVITGKRGMETPQMAALMRYAVLNPYWNLPPDLVRDRVTHHVLIDGPQWLKHAGLKPVSGYGPNAQTLDPQAVDWVSVMTGTAEIGLRQDPGPLNTMGAVKFMFPNELGIYLHDTPEKGLFRASDRQFSSGCVRLEDAPALYRWLIGDDLPVPDPNRPEQRVNLPAPVPVYILHLPSLERDMPPRLEGRIAV